MSHTITSGSNDADGSEAGRQRILEGGEDTALNMTPMIDIVFQLVTFFLLTLHFSPTDRRLDVALPHKAGIRPDFQIDDRRPLQVKVFREKREDPDAAFTRVRVGAALTIDLPREDAPGRREATSRIASAIAAQRDALAAAGPVRGTIEARPPSGGMVPHGDVMAILDAFVEAQVKEVAFQGTAPVGDMFR